MNKKKNNNEEVIFGMKLREANKKNDYIRNIINGRYFLARCNMIATQIQNNDIKEKIDGCIKTEEYMRSEYAMQKMQAIMSMRNAYFAKKDLFEDFKFNDKDILSLEEDYYDGKVIREDYDELYKKDNKAKFVK
ncbi:MAG TPA: hypothetical protein ENI61_01685 [Ignavibacteria bacterium]|nr:hypothetical protein [Ignavibacteria bacterium]